MNELKKTKAEEDEIKRMIRMEKIISQKYEEMNKIYKKYEMQINI